MSPSPLHTDRPCPQNKRLPAKIDGLAGSYKAHAIHNNHSDHRHADILLNRPCQRSCGRMPLVGSLSLYKTDLNYFLLQTSFQNDTTKANCCGAPIAPFPRLDFRAAPAKPRNPKIRRGPRTFRGQWTGVYQPSPLTLSPNLSQSRE